MKKKLMRMFMRIEYPYNVIHVGKKLQENINRDFRNDFWNGTGLNKYPY